jgi:hypothetical protein
MRENYAAKARRLLGEARLTVRRVDGEEIAASCRGDSGEVYSVGHGQGEWYCTCPAKGRCSHLQSLMWVTVVGGTA